MLDSEKIELIDMMITDFWNFLTEEQYKENALGLIVAIGSVCGMKRKENK